MTLQKDFAYYSKTSQKQSLSAAEGQQVVRLTLQ